MTTEGFQGGIASLTTLVYHKCDRACVARNQDEEAVKTVKATNTDLTILARRGDRIRVTAPLFCRTQLLVGRMCYSYGLS